MDTTPIITTKHEIGEPFFIRFFEYDVKVILPYQYEATLLS
jgi:hypothetical protein